MYEHSYTQFKSFFSSKVVYTFNLKLEHMYKCSYMCVKLFIYLFSNVYTTLNAFINAVQVIFSIVYTFNSNMYECPYMCFRLFFCFQTYIQVTMHVQTFVHAV